MTIASGFLLYFMLWWIVLFTVLPLWTRRDESLIEGQDQGAPTRPYLWRKVLLTSLLTAVVWAGLVWGLGDAVAHLRE